MEIRLHVPQILQNPELPNGCEITSCCEVLNYLGYPADKCDLADHYLPRSEFWYGTDPDLYYMGDPHRDDHDPRTGYYCFAGPVVKAANRYMKEYAGEHSARTEGCRYTARDITGAAEEDLIDQLKAGRPFIFWASLHFDDIRFDSCGSYTLEDGREHRVFHQLHCMVCDGVDDAYFYLSDPLDYNEKVSRGQFMKIFRQLGSRAVVFVPEGEGTEDTIRSFGFTPGFLPCGPKNSICDVPGVRVGHWTLHDEKHHTGVTVILPRDDIYENKCVAAAYVQNGYGKSTGFAQIEELGQLESPIALTNTLNVGLVSDALVQYTLEERQRKGKTLRSFNPVVGECNDAALNTICERCAGYEQVMEAIRSAKEDFRQGCAGAGAGMTCHGLKGGIGSASRRVIFGDQCWTVGVLALCNHGELKELSILGKKVGPEIEERLRRIDRHGSVHSEDRGSCMMILATDLPLSDRQLKRVIRRTGVGMARCGSFWGHGSGDFAIGFTTSAVIHEDEPGIVLTAEVLNENRLDPVFAAAAEASEEAVLNALAAARTTAGPDGTVRHALREFADLL